METSSDTSTRATLRSGQTGGTASSPRERFGPLPSPDEATGSGCTVDCTMLEEETSPTHTSEDDCDFEFIFQAGDRHPVGLVCSTHDMTFDIGTGV